jgi:formamidopyrimidine-DNA glycosylase
MPELPEVESTVRYLQERVTGLTIVDANIHWPRSVATHTPKKFTASVSGLVIERVFRRGKFIVIASKSPKPSYIFVHLRMSGSLDVVSQRNPVGAHDRAILELSNGKSIRFNDTRKFGRIYLCQDPASIVGRLGVEPLSSDFTPERLHLETLRRSTRIKTFLLDQRVIAGLGNIYVDECLWKAQIHPLTPAEKLSLDSCSRLHAAIVETLNEAISLSGTDFGDGVVDGGMYQPLVYAQDGKECRRCNTVIKKTVVGQRGTHFCPKCQPKPRKSKRKSRPIG